MQRKPSEILVTVQTTGLHITGDLSLNNLLVLRQL
jgi:hypothetical protein